MRRRWRTRRISRTGMTVATAETLVEMPVSRMAAATSVPPTSTVGASGSVPMDSGKPLRRSGDRVGVGEVDTFVEAPPGERAVHGAGVEVAVAEGPRDLLADARLAGPRGPVHGDDETGQVVLGGLRHADEDSASTGPPPDPPGGRDRQSWTRQPRRASSARNGSTEAGTTEISATPTAWPSPCSRWRSSRLMPASPTSVSSRASDPGLVGDDDGDDLVRRWGRAVLAGDPCVAEVAGLEDPAQRAERRRRRRRPRGRRGRRRRRRPGRGRGAGRRARRGRCRRGSGSRAGGRSPRSGSRRAVPGRRDRRRTRAARAGTRRRCSRRAGARATRPPRPRRARGPA